MSPFIVGLLGIVFFVVLLLLKVPIAASFAIVGFLGHWYLGGLIPSLSVLGSVPFSWGSHYTLLAIPLFVLMGQTAFQGGISGMLYDTAYKWLGRFPGGVAIATMGACAMFAACTGSSTASAATMGTLALPEMRKFKYDRKLAAGTVAMGGTLGILIPPSMGFIIYGSLTETSVGKLFIAGILPGLLITLLFCLSIYLRARINPQIAPPGEVFGWKDRFVSLWNVWAMLTLFLIVMGGLYFGVVTPTEGAGVGAFGALAIALFRRRLNSESLLASLKETARVTCMIFAIYIGAMIFSTFLAVTRLPYDLGIWVTDLALPRYGVLSIILLMYIPLGCLMDALAMLILTVPIIFPVIEALGFSSIWFGVLVVILSEIALVTPPVGLNCFVVSGVAKDVPLEDIFRGILPFLVLTIVGLIILVSFPSITLLLIGTMK